MSNIVQSYTSWQPLEEVIVGRVYSPEYFDFIQDANVRGQLAQILSETEEDLDNLQRAIERFGARVHRPGLPNLENFRGAQAHDANNIPIPPLTPRDWQITLGEKLLRILHVKELDDICDELQKQDPDCVIDPHEASGGWNPDHPITGAIASCIVRVGTDIFFDNSEWMSDRHINWIRQNVLDDRFRVRRAVTHGHGDSVFAILKPGVILSTMHDSDINYQQDFPGWEVLKIWDASIWAAMEIGKFKYESFNERWWVQGQNSTPEFAHFVDTYLSQWTGFVKETVFDVNCLVLDEQHVIFSGYNKTVFDFCRRHGIEPIVCEFRHKYFFDGGISCCTQDIRRRGGLETYL